VLKVFLVDMRDLTGIYQGLSFIGHGIVLLGIGWLYQRLLFPRRTSPGCIAGLSRCSADPRAASALGWAAAHLLFPKKLVVF
jgi:hypothetical protein